MGIGTQTAHTNSHSQHTPFMLIGIQPASTNTHPHTRYAYRHTKAYTNTQTDTQYTDYAYRHTKRTNTRTPHTIHVLCV